MDQRPVSFLDKVTSIPWWLNAAIGAILFLGSEDLTSLKIAGLPLEWLPRYIQLLGCIFIACAIISILLRVMSAINPEDQNLPAPDQAGPPAPKKKYTERDFMPPELRAQDAPADPEPKP